MREESPMSEAKPKSKKRRARRKFTAEFKADVVRLCRSGNETIPDVARRLDLTETAVRAWVRQAAVDEQGGTSDALTTSEKTELVRLRRELKRVTEERDILKKATAFFARESS
jgi:transposase